MSIISKPRNPNRDKSFKIYMDRNGKVKLTEIANILNEKVSNIRTWKRLDKWEDEINKVGAPKGNQNALNKGAPKGNQNHRKHGFYSKYLPKKVYNIFEDADDMDSIEMLRIQIKLKHANILNIQKEIKSGKGLANLIKAESLAVESLGNLIKTYEVLINKNSDLDTEEQKARIKKIKQDTAYTKVRTEVEKSKITNNEKTKEDKIDGFFEKLEECISNVK